MAPRSQCANPSFGNNRTASFKVLVASRNSPAFFWAKARSRSASSFGSRLCFVEFFGRIPLLDSAEEVREPLFAFVGSLDFLRDLASTGRPLRFFDLFKLLLSIAHLLEATAAFP